MRFREIIAKEAITPTGGVGSTTSPVQNGVPSTATGGQKPGTTPTANTGTNVTQQTPDPNVTKLAATLRQNKIISNDKEVNDVMSAFQAQETGKTLNPQQQQALAKVGAASLNNPNAPKEIDTIMKLISAKSGTSPG